MLVNKFPFIDRRGLPGILWWALVASVTLPGCATLSPRSSLPEVHAIDGRDTPLGRASAQARTGFEAGKSGFRLLPEAAESFNARGEMARLAQVSIDAQYYLIGDDDIGRAFLRELRDASARGVRVRLLVDDLYNAGKDPLLAGLAAYPGVEVRLFNPLPSRSDSFNWRIASSLWEFERINHRMHNKLFVADNALAVSGGRNMASEYFEQDATANFVDLDVLSAGPIVQDMSAAFDRYWNSARAFPIGWVAHPRDSAKAREAFDTLVRKPEGLLPERTTDVLGGAAIRDSLQRSMLQLLPAQAKLLVDDPMKAATPDGSQAAPTVSDQTIGLMATAHQSVRIVSPYFIPGERAMKLIETGGPARNTGALTVTTNSLGSTDETLVYAEYAKYRLRMLQAGVRIFEVGAELGGSPQNGGSLVGTRRGAITRLHAKVATIDDHLVYVGSMNFDGRSAYRNTEIGLLIDSREIASSLSTIFRGNLMHAAYELRLSKDGSGIVWVSRDSGGQETVYSEEPQNTWWARTRMRFLLRWIDTKDL